MLKVEPPKPPEKPDPPELPASFLGRRSSFFKNLEAALSLLQGEALFFGLLGLQRISTHAPPKAQALKEPLPAQSARNSIDGSYIIGYGCWPCGHLCARTLCRMSGSNTSARCEGVLPALAAAFSSSLACRDGAEAHSDDPGSSFLPRA